MLIVVASAMIVVVAVVDVVVVIFVVRCLCSELTPELNPAEYSNVPRLLLSESDSPLVVFIMIDAGDE